MEEREGSFAGAGGLEIHWRSWRPEGAPRAAVVIAHGAGEHCGRYGHVAARLVADGNAVYALDHRGHGRSQGRRAFIDRLANALDDLDVVVTTAADEQGAAPWLLGHSMGGCIALAYATSGRRRLAGLALSAPLAALEAAPPGVRTLSKVLSALTPSLGVYSVDAELVSRDPDEVRAYVEDPLVHHGKLPARTVAELTRAIEGFPEGVASLALPLLVMHGTADRLTPPAGSQMVSDRAGSADKTLLMYDGYYHELFNEPAADRARVLDDLAGWLAART